MPADLVEERLRDDVEATHAKLAERLKLFDGLVVTTGFLGQTADGRTTTLGRNGSDYTATLLARGLKAKEVNVWTDVPGVMTADPGIVDDVIVSRNVVDRSGPITAARN